MHTHLELAWMVFIGALLGVCIYNVIKLILLGVFQAIRERNVIALIFLISLISLVLTTLITG